MPQDFFSSPSRHREHHTELLESAAVLWKQKLPLDHLLMFNALGSGSKPDAEIEHVEAPRQDLFFGPEEKMMKNVPCTVYL